MADRNGCEHARLEYDVTIAGYDKPRQSPEDKAGVWIVAELKLRCSLCRQVFTGKNLQPGIVGDIPVRHPDGTISIPLELFVKPEAQGPPKIDKRIIIPGGVG